MTITMMKMKTQLSMCQDRGKYEGLSAGSWGQTPPHTLLSWRQASVWTDGDGDSALQLEHGWQLDLAGENGLRPPNLAAADCGQVSMLCDYHYDD